MGEQAYEHCSTSEEEIMRADTYGAQRKLVCRYCAALFVFVILTCVFFILYLVEKSSGQARQGQECQLQNQTQAQVSALQKRLEEAQKDAGNLSRKLGAANESLEQTQKKWQSCQNQLNTLQENITSLEAEKHKSDETVKDLKQQLDGLQKERKSLEAEIKTLREQHESKQKQGSNGGNFFGGLSLVLFTITLAGSLCV